MKVRLFNQETLMNKLGNGLLQNGKSSVHIIFIDMCGIAGICTSKSNEELEHLAKLLITAS